MKSPSISLLQCPPPPPSSPTPLSHALTLYWLLAWSRSANNQWKLSGELTKDPEDTSFFKALRLSKGTVSILDKGGVVFTRVWCSFEIYVSLVGSKPGFLWDVYTALDGASETPAVGITDGLAECDQGQPINKGKRESQFPSELARSALGIELEKAQASMDEDRRRFPI